MATNSNRLPSPVNSERNYTKTGWHQYLIPICMWRHGAKDPATLLRTVHVRIGEQTMIIIKFFFQLLYIQSIFSNFSVYGMCRKWKWSKIMSFIPQRITPNGALAAKTRRGYASEILIELYVIDEHRIYILLLLLIRFFMKISIF